MSSSRRIGPLFDLSCEKHFRSRKSNVRTRHVNLAHEYVLMKHHLLLFRVGLKQLGLQGLG
jgi:uncharacterized C2H2 Zn-finger protein